MAISDAHDAHIERRFAEALVGLQDAMRRRSARDLIECVEECIAFQIKHRWLMFRAGSVGDTERCQKLCAVQEQSRELIAQARGIQAELDSGSAVRV